MRYCKTCKINYDTDLEHCILCGGDLEIGEHDHSVYKFKKASKKPKSNFFFRLFIFLNIMSILVTLGLDYIDGLPLSWSLIVSATNIYTVILLVILANPNFWVSKFTKIVIFTISVIIIIGLSIRDRSWAIDIVFPLAILSTMFMLTILIITNRKKWFDYFSSLLVLTIFGLVPGLLFIFNVLEVTWPSIVCVIYSIITLLGMIFLPSKNAREEFKRRFHV